MNEEINLDNELSAVDTSRGIKYGDTDMTVDQRIFKEEDPFTQKLKESEDATQAKDEVSEETVQVVEPDDFYKVEGDAPYVLIESRSLFKCLAQLHPVVHLNGARAVARGISIRSIDEQTIEIISPNDLFYFKSILEVENKIPKGEVIFMEYEFLTKLVNFFPSKTLIFKQEDKYYIRLKTTDLELQNSYLIEADLKKLDPHYNILDEVVSTIEPTIFSRKIAALSNLLKFESDANHKHLVTFNGLTSFQSAIIKAGTKTTLPNNPIVPKVIDYLLKACQLITPDTNIIFKATDSDITRYAICYNQTMLVANFSDSREDPRLRELLSEVPDLVKTDYAEWVYNLKMATSINYAKGWIEFTYENNKLMGHILLQNGSYSPIEINLLESAPFLEGVKFKINSKTLLTSFGALDNNLELKIGFKDNFLYFVNSDVTLIIVCI